MLGGGKNSCEWSTTRPPARPAACLPHCTRRPHTGTHNQLTELEFLPYPIDRLARHTTELETCTTKYHHHHHYHHRFDCPRTPCPLDRLFLVIASVSSASSPSGDIF